MKKLYARLRIFLAGVVILLVGVTCRDGGVTGPMSRGGVTRLGFLPALSRAAVEIFQNLESFGFEVNNVRVHLKHANGTTAKDTIVAVGSSQDSVVIQMGVALEGAQETLDANIELRDDNVVLFSGTQKVTAKSGSTPGAPPTVPWSSPAREPRRRRCHWRRTTQ